MAPLHGMQNGTAQTAIQIENKKAGTNMQCDDCGIEREGGIEDDIPLCHVCYCERYLLPAEDPLA